MKVIEIPANVVPRKAFELDADEQHFVDFKPGIEVLPAQYAGCDTNNIPVFYFVQRHEPGTPHWRDGGFECTDSSGAYRAFYLDSLIVHPKYFKRKAKAKAILERKGTGKRGRPRKDPSQLQQPKVYVPTGGKRGRPRKDPNMLQAPKVYVPTGGKRGRPKMDPALRKSTVYVKKGGKRGRPKKQS